MATYTHNVDMIDLHQAAIRGLDTAERSIEEARRLGCAEITGHHGGQSPEGLIAALALLRRDLIIAVDLIVNKTPSHV